MYLLDTNVISESRKGIKANQGVQRFFQAVINEQVKVYISSVTIGEIRRGIELLKHRRDDVQAKRLALWLDNVLVNYHDDILPFDTDAAQVWGKLRVPHYENAIDKQIAAIALIYDLTIVTRNTQDFNGCGVRLLNPFD